MYLDSAFSTSRASVVGSFPIAGRSSIRGAVSLPSGLTGTLAEISGLRQTFIWTLSPGRSCTSSRETPQSAAPVDRDSSCIPRSPQHSARLRPVKRNAHHGLRGAWDSSSNAFEIPFRSRIRQENRSTQSAAIYHFDNNLLSRCYVCFMNMELGVDSKPKEHPNARICRQLALAQVVAPTSSRIAVD